MIGLNLLVRELQIPIDEIWHSLFSVGRVDAVKQECDGEGAT